MLTSSTPTQRQLTHLTADGYRHGYANSSDGRLDIQSRPLTCCFESVSSHAKAAVRSEQQTPVVAPCCSSLLSGTPVTSILRDYATSASSFAPWNHHLGLRVIDAVLFSIRLSTKASCFCFLEPRLLASSYDAPSTPYCPTRLGENFA